MENFQQVLSVVGFVIRAIGFIVLGFAVGRFTMDAYKKAVWQVQIALAVGFFALLVGLTNYSSAGSMGTFALGAGVALIMSFMPPKKDNDEDSKK
ncbi:MAG: hypothetical protein KF758_00905 [Anaerolineales bacterium]|nr:hypothetical protein [Anaerolineales bacterium]MBX3035444.1 hypothetical protein [Anaerolineales bacterium]